MAIAVLDNDVLVNLYDFVYLHNKSKWKQVIEYLVLRYKQIWIPKLVRNEFLGVKQKTRKSKREKWLDRVLDRYATIIDCPVPVSDNDRALIVSDIVDHGEADGIMQIKNAETFGTARYRIPSPRFVFVSADWGAIRGAMDAGIATDTYYDIRDQLREIGIEMP